MLLGSRMAFSRTVLESLAAEGCTGFAGVPLTFEIFRRQVDLSTIDFPCSCHVTQAGGAMAPDTIDWARSAFRPVRLFVMYGQTEAAARLSYPSAGAGGGQGGLDRDPAPWRRAADCERGGRGPPAGRDRRARRPRRERNAVHLGEPEETAPLSARVG